MLAPWVDLLNHSSEAGVCLLTVMPSPSRSTPCERTQKGTEVLGR